MYSAVFRLYFGYTPAPLGTPRALSWQFKKAAEQIPAANAMGLVLASTGVPLFRPIVSESS